MPTKDRTLARYLIPVMAALAFLMLAPDGLAAGSAAAKGSRKPLTSSAASKTLAPKNKITISLSHWIRQGNLVVSLDDTPVFNEGFTKPIYLISQTTTWDPLEAPVGKHRLTARVIGKNGKTYTSGTYELQLGRSKAVELRIRMKGDKLTIDQTS